MNGQEKAIRNQIEKETRVEMKSVPDIPSQLNRIERMLKWLVITTQMERRSTLAGLGCNPEAIGKELNGLCGRAPDISDILEEK